MLRAGAHTGTSAVLLVEDIPAAELTKPELVMRMLMRQAGPLKAYTFFPGPAAAAAAELDRPDVAKQVMRRSRALNLSGPPAEQICGMRKGATMEGTLITLASQDKASPAVVPRAVTALFRPSTAAQHAQRCACVLCAGVQAVRRVCDGAPAAARRVPAALPHRRRPGADGCGAEAAAMRRRRGRRRCHVQPRACRKHGRPATPPPCCCQGKLQAPFLPLRCLLARARLCCCESCCIHCLC